MPDFLSKFPPPPFVPKNCPKTDNLFALPAHAKINKEFDEMLEDITLPEFPCPKNQEASETDDSFMSRNASFFSNPSSSPKFVRPDSKPRQKVHFGSPDSPGEDFSEEVRY